MLLLLLPPIQSYIMAEQQASTRSAYPSLPSFPFLLLVFCFDLVLWTV
jgi:hypothetical protein